MTNTKKTQPPLAEVLVAVDLREDLSDAESAELAFALENEGWA